MRWMALACVLAVALHLAGCNAPSNDNQSTEDQHVEEKESNGAKSFNPDFLSPDRSLFLLSTHFGVCARDTHVLRSIYDNGMPGAHFPTYVKFVLGGSEFFITVGDFVPNPDAVVRDIPDIPAASLPRRIRISRWEEYTSLLVSDFDGAGKNIVSIAYDDSNANARAEAMRLANSVVACHVSAREP